MSDTIPCSHWQFTEHRSYCPDCGLSRSEVQVADCEPYLKDGETPAECIVRNRRDASGALTMMIEERRKVEALSARLAEAEERRLRVYAWLGYWRDKMPPEAVEALQDILGSLIAADSASVEGEK